jgi:hypothetical protein
MLMTMARQMTVVSTMEPVIDDEGNLLDKDGNVINPSKKTKKDQVPVMEEVFYYLLHWGLTYEILIDNQQRYPVSYTVGICQHIKTGAIRTFIPQELTVIGKEMKV